MFEDFLVLLKACLGDIFLDRDFDSFETWEKMASTQGWGMAMKEASSVFPEIYDVWDKLDWWASDTFDGWICDCAKAFGLCEDRRDEEVMS